VYVVVTAGVTMAVPDSPMLEGSVASAGFAVIVAPVNRPGIWVASQARVAESPARTARTLSV